MGGKSQAFVEESGTAEWMLWKSLTRHLGVSLTGHLCAELSIVRRLLSPGN